MASPRLFCCLLPGQTHDLGIGQSADQYPDSPLPILLATADRKASDGTDVFGGRLAHPAGSLALAPASHLPRSGRSLPAVECEHWSNLCRGSGSLALRSQLTSSRLPPPASMRTRVAERLARSSRHRFALQLVSAIASLWSGASCHQRAGPPRSPESGWPALAPIAVPADCAGWQNTLITSKGGFLSTGHSAHVHIHHEASLVW